MKPNEIIKKLEAPLLFSSKDDFRHLALVKGLETTVAGLAAELERAEEGTAPDIREAFASMAAAFRGFDAMEQAEKRRIIHEALTTLAGLGALPPVPAEATVRKPEPPPPPTGPAMAAAFRNLASPIQFVKGVGPKIAFALERKEIRTVEDLLYFFPRRYEDRRHMRTIGDAAVGSRECVVGEVVEAKLHQYGHRRTFEAALRDATGILVASWFKGNPSYLKNTFKAGQKVLLTGEVRIFGGKKSMVHPDFEVMDEGEEDSPSFKRIVPVYSETEGVHPKVMRRIALRAVLDFGGSLLGPVPEWIRVKRDFPSIQESVRALHLPSAEENVETLNEGKSVYHHRLIYDEFFFFELAMALKKKGQVLERGIAFATDGDGVGRFLRLLPFELTGAQRRVVDEIRNDMAKSAPMNRLLQGDVGSGKTVVSMAAMVTACENGFQSAIMAPTEILAEQHYRSICGWAEALGLRVALVTGNRKAKARRETAEAIAAGTIDIAVGTHALIQDDLAFPNLGLVVIDEQHRFGVMQRAALRQKGGHPDVLVMTATPIPRTLAMTVYGDLDVSVIDELPPAKKPIKTKVYFEGDREKVYAVIDGELKKGHQVFVVYPLVEESEKLDLKDATHMAEHLQNEIFPAARIGLIHGRMSGEEKDRIMSDFQGRRIDLLVATTIIEVGIDVPAASLIVIEHAERFGLSQLHQLRGRVGRGDVASSCILLAQHAGSDAAKRRLRIMEKTNDGFLIAEEDLAIRGPGEFMGTKQSGIPDFRVASIVRDGRILGEAREDAFLVAQDDPSLAKPENRAMHAVLMHRWKGRLDLAKTG